MLSLYLHQQYQIEVEVQSRRMLDLSITNHLRLRLARFRKSNIHSKLLGLQSDPALLLALLLAWDREGV